MKLEWNNSVQFIPEVIVYKTDTQEMDFFLSIPIYSFSSGVPPAHHAGGLVLSFNVCIYPGDV